MRNGSARAIGYLRVSTDQQSDSGLGLDAQRRAIEQAAQRQGLLLAGVYESGQRTSADAAHQRGVTYLLRTQLADGTWFVRSRAFGFQPYFESGFPHGVDQFISASATAWAAIALAHAL